MELLLRYSAAPHRAQLTAIDVPLRVPSEHHLLFYFWSRCILWDCGCCAVTGVHLFVATQWFRRRTLHAFEKDFDFKKTTRDSGEKANWRSLCG